MKFNGRFIQRQTHSTPPDVNEPWYPIAHRFAIERLLVKLSPMCGLRSGLGEPISEVDVRKVGLGVDTACLFRYEFVKRFELETACYLRSEF